MDRGCLLAVLSSCWILYTKRFGKEYQQDQFDIAIDESQSVKLLYGSKHFLNKP